VLNFSTCELLRAKQLFPWLQRPTVTMAAVLGGAGMAPHPYPGNGQLEKAV
jgi:hypothetical protein